MTTEVLFGSMYCFNSFHLGIIMSMLCFEFVFFTGLIFLFKAFREMISGKDLLIQRNFFFPSLLFWGSGLLKDGFCYSRLAYYIFSFESQQNSVFQI